MPPVKPVKCNLSGLAGEWEETASVRARMKNGEDLIREFSEKQVDLRTPAKYNDILKPILARMMVATKAKLPSIDALREQVEVFMQACKRDPNTADVDKFAWLIRKNLGFVKLKVRRLEVSTASQMKLQIAFRTQHVLIFV